MASYYQRHIISDTDSDSDHEEAPSALAAYKSLDIVFGLKNPTTYPSAVAELRSIVSIIGKDKTFCRRVCCLVEEDIRKAIVFCDWYAVWLLVYCFRFPLLFWNAQHTCCFSDSCF